MRAFVLPLTVAGALFAGVLAEGCLGSAVAFGDTEVYGKNLCCCNLVAGGTCCNWQTVCSRQVAKCGACE